MTDRDTAHVIAALAALLLCAHAGGYLFSRYGQPQVIGEILGGLMLGPTVLGRRSPRATTGSSPATARPPRAVDGGPAGAADS